MNGQSPQPLLLVLHGPNLNLLGDRPAAHYGTVTLPELEQRLREEAAGFGWRCLCYQTNYEGRFIELVHEYRLEASATIVNPGAWTHYSYAIRDALELVRGPIAEVHLSDITAREEWRRISVVAPLAAYRVMGKGPDGYSEALRALVRLVDGERNVER